MTWQEPAKCSKLALGFIAIGNIGVNANFSTHILCFIAIVEQPVVCCVVSSSSLNHVPRKFLNQGPSCSVLSSKLSPEDVHYKSVKTCVKVFVCFFFNRNTSVPG